MFDQYSNASIGNLPKHNHLEIGTVSLDLFTLHIYICAMEQFVQVHAFGVCHHFKQLGSTGYIN